MKPARIRSAASQLRGAKVKANIGKGEAAREKLVAQVADVLPYHSPEWRFHPTRKWRVDILFHSAGIPVVAVEIEGGGWVGGAHSRGKHFAGDCEKYAEFICIVGVPVLRVTHQQIQSGQAASWLRRIAERA